MKRYDTTYVHDWDDIRHNFSGADVFLGNGFSISISPKFNYSSLFETFLTHCNAKQISVFSRFNSTNFEAIQHQLQSTIETNGYFAVNSSKIRNASKTLRKGLIRAVKDLHPPFQSLGVFQMSKIARAFDQFGDVYTLNYDTFLYHLIMHMNDRAKKSKTLLKYQDFFRRRDKRLIFNRYFAAPGYRNVYYLHGALFIFRDEDTTQTIKVTQSKDEDLLEVIKSKIEVGTIPIFVSEGTSVAKMKTIESNAYLDFCNNSFSLAMRNLVIFGFSFSDYDRHWVDIINAKGKNINLAISLYLAGKTKADILSEIKAVQAKLSLFKSRNIKFFDSSTMFS